jgi:predicted ribosomally synthesized peptide with SipW-like signal peptide
MNVKKKLALWSATGLMGISLTIGGATFAIFTDSASSTNNTFTAGTIDLTQERDSGDSIPGPMFYTGSSDSSGYYPYDETVPSNSANLGGESLGGWAPGDKVVRAMNIYNKGTLAAKITKLQATISNGTGTYDRAAYNHFIDKMNIKVTYNTGSRPVIYNGSLRGLLSGWVPIALPITAAPNSGAINIEFEASLDTSAENIIMGKTFVFDFSFYAEQFRNN